MAQVEVSLKCHTRLARCVMWLLAPAVFVGAVSPERAADIVMRFIRITVD